MLMIMTSWIFCWLWVSGIESLSMGAKFATFVDKSPISIKYIKENLNKCSFKIILKL